MSESKAKILIVDDDDDQVAALRVVLESRQYRVVSASGTKTGTEVLEREAPDLIILDMMMEGKGAGFLFSRQVRKMERFKGIPILMLTGMRSQTGFSFPGKDKDPQFLPVDEFAEKPLNPQDLLRRVEGLLAKARAA
ncbi:MAG: response regulator [Elusimicrobia bacterium]|nr:response regulator [Elusimicrobiota bacterium]